jgi:23S rRNA G2069 N7-methylase RlmK/C1962 C5-methylase RlmI
VNALPQITVLPGKHKRAKSGHPWIYANEVAMTPETKALQPGTLVSVVNSGGEPLGTAFFSASTLAVARFISRRPAQAFIPEFVAVKLRAAQAWREKLFDQPYYRLLHAEADGLPGLIIDRFGSGVVCQFNCAGLELHREAVLAELRLRLIQIGSCCATIHPNAGWNACQAWSKRSKALCPRRWMLWKMALRISPIQPVDKRPAGSTTNA